MNNRNQEKHFIVDILFVLALFGVFAVSALALVTIPPMGRELEAHRQGIPGVP